MTSPFPALPAPVPAVLLAVAAAVPSAVLGSTAGALARRLLARLRRGARVPPPWCEAGGAVVWGSTGVAAAAGVVPLRWVPVLLALGWLAVAAAAVDVRCRRLPDALTLPALPVGLLLVAPLGPGSVLRGLAAAVVAATAYGVVHVVAPAALGAGDVKLAAPLGAVLGAASWDALALGALLAALFSAVVAAGTVAVGVSLRRGDRAAARRALPHGPSMLAASWLVATAAAGGARGP